MLTAAKWYGVIKQSSLLWNTQTWCNLSYNSQLCEYLCYWMIRNFPFAKCSFFILVLRWTSDSPHRHTHVQFDRHVNIARCKNLLNAGLSWPGDVTSPAGTCSCKKMKDIFYLFTYLFHLFIHGLFKRSVSCSMSKCKMAEHLVTSNLKKLCGEAVRLQHFEGMYCLLYQGQAVQE